MGQLGLGRLGSVFWFAQLVTKILKSLSLAVTVKCYWRVFWNIWFLPLCVIWMLFNPDGFREREKSNRPFFSHIIKEVWILCLCCLCSLFFLCGAYAHCGLYWAELHLGSELKIKPVAAASVPGSPRARSPSSAGPDDGGSVSNRPAGYSSGSFSKFHSSLFFYITWAWVVIGHGHLVCLA